MTTETDAAYEQGRQAERAAVVAWLGRQGLKIEAIDIACGAHLGAVPAEPLIEIPASPPHGKDCKPNTKGTL